MLESIKVELDSGEIDMSSLENSMSEIEVDCDLFSVPTQRTHTILRASACSPLTHFKFSDRTGRPAELFLNQGTGYSFADICSVKTVNHGDSESDESYSNNTLSKDTVRYEITKKVRSKRKLNKPSKIVKHRRIYKTEKDFEEFEEIEFEHIDKKYLVCVCKCLDTLSPEKAFYVKEIVVKEDNDGDRLIFIAIIMNRLDLCNLLIQFIPDECFLKTAQNKLYQTALHLAVLVGSSRLTRRFLVAGVQVDRRDYKGDTALHIACRRGNVKVARELLRPMTYLEAKQNPYDVSYQKIPQNLEIRNRDGLTCLHVAAYNQNTEMMELLLSKLANINEKDLKHGKTCLHIFTETGDVKCVQYLLRKPSINVNARTYAGFTALEMANCRHHSYIAYLLLCAGAKPKIRQKDSDDFKGDSDTD